MLGGPALAMALIGTLLASWLLNGGSRRAVYVLRSPRVLSVASRSCLLPLPHTPAGVHSSNPSNICWFGFVLRLLLCWFGLVWTLAVLILVYSFRKRGQVLSCQVHRRTSFPPGRALVLRLGPCWTRLTSIGACVVAVPPADLPERAHLPFPYQKCQLHHPSNCTSVVTG